LPSPFFGHVTDPVAADGEATLDRFILGLRGRDASEHTLR
jgi:hypothetical protein